MSGYNLTINVPYSNQTDVLTGFDGCPYIFVQASTNPVLDEVRPLAVSITALFAGIYSSTAGIPTYTSCDQLSADGNLVELGGPDEATNNWSFDQVCVASTDPGDTQYVEVWACLSDGSVIVASPNSFSVAGE
jgi:hypothetical protein